MEFIHKKELVLFHITMGVEGDQNKFKKEGFAPLFWSEMSFSKMTNLYLPHAHAHSLTLTFSFVIV